MTEVLNGHSAETIPGMRGRSVPAYPTLTLHESGYTVEVRRIPPGTVPQMQQRAAVELESERPAPPVQQVEVAEGQFQDVERTSDPDYQAALKEWEQRVSGLGSLKFARFVAAFAVVTPTDDDAVAAYKAAMAVEGVELTDSDRNIFIWSIVAPTKADSEQLIGFVIGISEAQMEAVRAHKATFRGDVPGQST